MLPAARTPYFFYRLSHSWQRKVRGPWLRWLFLADCYRHGVKVEMADDTQFHHRVRVWGIGGRITIESDVHFAFQGGSPWLGPIGIEMRSADSHLTLRRGVWVMRAARFMCMKSITVGEGVTVGDGCLLLDSNIHDFTPGSWHGTPKSAPIVIGARSHLAPDVTILKGVTVGEDSMIGNRSVLQRSVPSRSVVMGNPARVMLRYAAPAAASL